MAIIGRDQALARQLGQKRPGEGNLYGGPPQPPAPAPATPRPQADSQGKYDLDGLLNRTWDTGSKSGDGGGGIGSAIMGGLGTVLGGAAKGLDFVSNVGLLAAEELSEFLGRDEFESQKNADGTLNEFGKQGNWEKLNDPEYGFGKLMGNVTGNKWADRAIGFVGDAGFDPFSYVGGAAVKSTMAMGKAGREALVVKAAGMGMSDDVVTHLGKFGHVGLDDATREALGVKKAGVYWGVGDASIRLPGTKTIGTAAEKTFGSVRRNTAGRLVGKVGKGRGEESLAIFRRVAQTGKTIDGVTPKNAGLTLGLINKFKAASAEAAEPFARLAQKSFQSWDDTTRVRVTKEIESLNLGWTADMGPTADPAKLAKLSPEAQEVIALRDLIYSSVKEATGGAVDMGFRGPGYMPHRSTREAWDFFGDDSAVRQLLNGGDLDSGQGAALKRVFLPGKTVDVKGRAVTFGDASIDDINAKLTEAFPEAGVTKWVEDNSVVLVERYISEMSRIQGHHAMLTDAVEKGALGNLKHLTDDIVEGMLNVSKNKEVSKLLKDELAQRSTHQAYLRGEAARIGQLISKELDGALVRMADEAGAEHATLKRFVDGIQKELKDDAGDRTANLKRIAEKFDAERKRLGVVAEKMFNAKAAVDADIAALEQRIADGFVQESAQTRKLLDEWIASSNSYAQKLKVETAAREGLTTLDEMYGLVFAQAGRLDEVADSPDLLMEVFADMKGVNLVSSKSPLLEEVRVDEWAVQSAKENQELLELLKMDGTVTNWEEAVDAIVDAAGNPYLTQGRVDIRLSMVDASLNKMDEGIEAQARAVADLRVGAWEQTGVTMDGTPLDEYLVELNKESVVSRNKAVRQLTSSSSLSKKKARREVALQQTRDLENVKRQLIGLKNRVEAKAKETSTVQSKIELEELTIARDKMMARYSELEDSSLSYVTQKVNSRGALGLSGGDLYEDQLTDEIIGLLNEMKAARKAIIDADQVIKNNSVSPQMASWLDATGPGSPLMKMRRRRAWLSQEQTELRNWTSPPDSRTIVDTAALERGREALRAQKAAGSSVELFDEEAARINSGVVTGASRVEQAPLLGPGAPYGPELPTYRLDTQPFYGPQRPAPTFPETYRAGSMENARVIDRRDMAQNILFMQDLDRKKGSYRRIHKYLDDDGVIKTKYEDVTTEVPVVANPRTREELQAAVKVAQQEVDAQQQIIDGLAYIPSTAGVIDDAVRGEISPAVLTVMRTLLDGIEDGVDSSQKSFKNIQNARRRDFPQTLTQSHDKFSKGELPRPVNSPKHPDFQGNYQDWSPADQELFNRANELSKIEHSTKSFTREQYDEWEALGKRADGSGKYDPDSPFNLTWKQTPPYETLGSNELALDFPGVGKIRQIDEDEAGNQLTQSVGDLIGVDKDGSLSASGPQRRGAEDGYGGMAPDGASARDGGQDLVALEKEAKGALREAEDTRDHMYASLGLSDDLVRQAAGGGVGAQRNVLLFARESFEGKVSYAADGVPTTPRQLAKEVSDNYGGDFAAYKVDFPDTTAKDFLPPVGSAKGGLGYKESAKALGGEARNFTHGTENFAKYVDRSDQMQMGNMKARDILEQMDPEDRQKIYSYARQEAGEVRKAAALERKLKQAELDEATEQLLGQKNLREKLKRGAGNTRKAQAKFEDKAGKVRADAAAERQPLLDELDGLRPSQAEMADDGPFGVNKLIEVEDAIGKQEAAEMAQLDAVRSSLEADEKVFTEHKGWAESRLNRIKALRKRTGKKGLSGYKWGENTTEAQFAKRLDEFENILRLSMVEGPDSRSFAATARLMDNYMNQLKGLDEFNRQTEGIEALYHKAAAGADGGKGFNLDMQRAMLDGYERLDSNLFPDFADMSINSQLKQNLENWMGAMNDDLNLKWFDEATQIFKSYATMTPGFHLRNYMGATFMNFSDGVTVADTRAANKHWRGYVADPQNYIKNLDDPQERAAFQAVFGVGAGGSFDAGEVGTGAGRAWKGLRSNKATRMSRRYGEDLVEGPVRLAAALNTTRRGGTMNDAMARVKRLHFDYSDLSALDQKIKRVIPFYMFMSRNLPLQIEQMWRRPKAYAVYNHFMNNFDESDENTLMPKYLKDAGAIVMGSSWFGDDSKDFVFAPDLQHNNLMQDIMAFSGQGEQGIPIVDGLLASGNPIVTKGVEIAFNHSGFRGGDAFFNKKQDEYGNWEDKSMQEQALERIMYGLEGVFTPTGTAKGLLGFNPLGSEESNVRLQDRQLQKTLNFNGLPFKQLGDFERDWERRRQEKEGQ